MDNDHMELGETGIVTTPYGFFNTITGERLDHDGLPIKDKDEE